MTQRDMAKALELGVSTIGQYEAGVREPNTKTLASIANLFRMGEQEKQEFFLAALAPEEEAKKTEPDAVHQSPDQILKGLHKRISEIRCPAILLCDISDVIAVNGVMLRLLRPPEDLLAVAHLEAGRRNLCRYVLDDQTGYKQKLSHAQWEQAAMSSISNFRIRSVSKRGTDSWKKTVEFLKTLPAYNRYTAAVIWAPQAEIQRMSNEYKVEKIEGIEGSSELHWFSETSSTYTRYGRISMIVYIPANEYTAAAFNRLCDYDPRTGKKSDNGPSQIFVDHPLWPDKPYLSKD
jgi:transcriptional regulator with XRE-family HTH domain